MTKPISRCLVQLHTVSKDMSGNATIKLRRRQIYADAEDPAPMTPHGDGEIVMHLEPGLAPVHLDPGQYFHLDLTPVANPG